MRKLFRTIDRPLLLLFSLLLIVGTTRCASSPQLSRLTVLVSGQTMGYLEHCGCSSGVTGGELRKARMLKQERDEALKPKANDNGKPGGVLMVELGDFSDSSTPVQRLLSEGVLQSMQQLKYDSVGLGIKELEFSQADLHEMLASSGLPLVAANLEFKAPQSGEDFSSQLNELIKPYIISEQPGGFKAGIIHVLDDRCNGMRNAELQEYSKVNGFSVSEGAKTAKELIAAHHSEADFWIVTVGSGMLQGIRPEALSDIEHVTLVIGLAGSNPAEAILPYFIDRPYQKAKDVIRVSVNFRKKGETPFIDQTRQNLLGTVKEDPEVKQIIAALKPRLEQLENDAVEELIRTKSELPHPWYVGHNTCMTCHSNITESLSHTKHRQAFVNLVHRDPAAQKDPRCLVCHVTGHNKPGGWNKLETQAKRDEMAGVSCEACHGPGEYHVAHSSDPAYVKPQNFSTEGRSTLGIQRADNLTCMKCHDFENSPSFNFEKYWPHIQHNLTMSVSPQPGSPSKEQDPMAGAPGRGVGSSSAHSH